MEARIDDAVGEGIILDDEVCPGPNLLLNPGAESAAGLPGWTQAAGDWQQRPAPPDPVEGEATFFAGASEQAELYQDVDVGAYASRIAAGDQHFAFEGWLRTADEVLARSPVRRAGSRSLSLRCRTFRNPSYHR